MKLIRVFSLLLQMQIILLLLTIEIILTTTKAFSPILCLRNNRAVISGHLTRGLLSSNYDEWDHENPISLEDVQQLTVSQIKQQLRLRGLPVTGRKAELIDRLVRRKDFDAFSKPMETSDLENDTSYRSLRHELENELQLEETKILDPKENFDPVNVEVVSPSSKAQEFARSRGKDFIDVTPFVTEKEAAEGVRSSQRPSSTYEDREIDTDEDLPEESSEVWGKDARIVDDYEGRSIIVDNLNRFVMEFKASNQTSCTAWVVASRDALRPFWEGNPTLNSTTSAEMRLRDIQKKREDAMKPSPRNIVQESDGLDQDDDEGYYNDVLYRDYSDWGEYTATGAQISAGEVQGVLLLSDVYGPFTDDNQALAEKIAFECQPVVVMAPDLFRGNPWKEIQNTGRNKDGESYEEWRADNMDDTRVHVDIRAAAACLRERYCVASVVIWGTCFGGGRALEAASGYFPNNNIFDVDGKVGPPPVDPMACIAWYPTRYRVQDLFGKSGQNSRTLLNEGNPNSRKVAVMAIFAGDDTLEGATPSDAALLKESLEDDDRVVDYMVKVFPNQPHGFAHIGRASVARQEQDKDEYERFVDNEFGGAGRVTIDTGEAEVACLLSTAWMETYSRVFLPTVGPLVSKDENELEWQRLEMKNLAEANTRDIREEINTALNEFTYTPEVGGRKLDRFDEESHDEIKKILMAYQMGCDAGENQILESDDINSAYEKLRRWDSTIQLF
jgi:dienelactone hydrolase